jgi:hypothetical protein
MLKKLQHYQEVLSVYLKSIRKNIKIYWRGDIFPYYLSIPSLTMDNFRLCFNYINELNILSLPVYICCYICLPPDSPITNQQLERFFTENEKVLKTINKQLFLNKEAKVIFLPYGKKVPPVMPINVVNVMNVVKIK